MLSHFSFLVFHFSFCVFLFLLSIVTQNLQWSIDAFLKGDEGLGALDAGDVLNFIVQYLFEVSGVFTKDPGKNIV